MSTELDSVAVSFSLVYKWVQVLWLVSPSRTGFFFCICSCIVRNKQVPFSMATGNEELKHECFPKHSRMGTTRMKQDKQIEEESKKRGVSGK